MKLNWLWLLLGHVPLVAVALLAHECGEGRLRFCQGAGIELAGAPGGQPSVLLVQGEHPQYWVEL